MLGGLVARRKPDLPQQAALAPAAFGRILKLQGSPERVCGLRQSARGLLNLRHVIQRQGRIDALAGHGQGLGLPQERALVVGGSSDSGRVLHERLLEMTQSKQDTAEARVRHSARRSDRRGFAVCVDGVLGRTSQNGHVADSQRLFVALVQIVWHAYMMTSARSHVAGT